MKAIKLWKLIEHYSSNISQSNSVVVSDTTIKGQKVIQNNFSQDIQLKTRKVRLILFLFVLYLFFLLPFMLRMWVHSMLLISR